MNTRSKQFEDSPLKANDAKIAEHILEVSTALYGEGWLLDEGNPAYGISQIAEVIIHNARNTRNRSLIFVAGNGGSSSNASHLALHLEDAEYQTVDLISRVPVLTAYANDYGYEEALIRQASTLKAGDVLFVISGSGNSKNVVSLARHVKLTEPDVIVLGLLGSDGGDLVNLCDRYVLIRSNDYGVIEDCHSVMIHSLHKILMREAGRLIRSA